jgi:hypothetical protein
LPRRGSSQRRGRDGSVGQTGIHPVFRPTEEFGLDERIKQMRADVLIEAPQALRLPVRDL